MSTDLRELNIDLLDHGMFGDHEPWEIFDVLLREAKP